MSLKSRKIFRSIDEPIRVSPSFEERWKKEDKGLITSWEVGREKALKAPELAISARANELPQLGWDGGHKEAVKTSKPKYGSLLYLAQWQGLRGDDLDIDFDRDNGKVMTCSRTGMQTIFTTDMEHFKG